MKEISAMKKKKSKPFQMKCFSDICTTILFIVVVFSFFFLMFSYADNLAPKTNSFRVNIRGQNKFAVKQYTWKCQNSMCVRFLAREGERISLETCNMLCSQPPIWPKPRNVTVTNQTYSIIDVESIEYNLGGEGEAKTMLESALNLFKENLKIFTPKNHSVLTGSQLTVSVVLKLYNVTKLKLDTDESYHLRIQKENQNVSAYISAETFFGARNALETLSQLIWFDSVEDYFKILHDIDIKDAPQFAYRGVMVDTARNFFPIRQLKKIVDGMSMSKLNVLHLHLTDAASFPVILPSVPELAQFGAYGPDMVYTQQDVKDLVQYARVRGVRVLLEIDAPSHVNAGWNFAKELLNEDYVICGETDFFRGHLNPDNNKVLGVLENIYRDLLGLTGDDELFHMGSDEIDLACWMHTEAAKSYHDMKSFWLNYTGKMLEKLKSANDGKYPEKIIVWSSPLTEYYNFSKLNKDMVVQFWLGHPDNFLRNGHQVIYSTVGHWYLDCGFGPWNPGMNHGNCDPYTPWQGFYKYKPWKEYGYKNLVLGGEVCLWTEQVEVDSLETRVWPRSAAFAERVWSDPEYFDVYDVYTRLVAFRERLVRRGIKNAAMWPRWCSQNPRRC